MKLMIGENIRSYRKKNGLTQEEFAERLGVTYQSVSGWENGLSVPDADMLVAIGEVFDTPVGILLGETVTPPQPDELRTISEKLEVINLQLARRSAERRRALHILFIVLCVVTAAGFASLVALGSPYLGWDYGDSETVVFGAAFHAFEWLFVRAAPLMLTAFAVGAVLTRRRT